MAKSTSIYLEQAYEILNSVRGKPQRQQERKRLSVELAALLLRAANASMTREEETLYAGLSRLMQDPLGKAFTTAMTDQCFRTKNEKRVADQMIYLLNQLGVPRYLDWWKRMNLTLFRSLGPSLAQYAVPLAIQELRKETSRVILPGEIEELTHHLRKRKKEGVRLNLNHLGEAILNESEAKTRLETYLKDLENPDIDYISVKISTLFSQIHLLDFDGTVEAIATPLRLLYRAAMKERESPRFINLDMEEYRDLHLTVSLFKKVLEEPEFHNCPAGIVLQAYLPDSYRVQKELTAWAILRVQNGGAPIKIRIVKGANLGMEQVEASHKGWPQAPYLGKLEVDANYKRMLIYGCLPEHARAVRLGIASHNLFDIAFAMLLRLENGVEAYTGFEMLEGMADHIRRVVQELTGDMLLYCPIATKEEFQHAIAYLIRRLDENTGPENFLRHIFGLKPGTDAWESQSLLFSQSCDAIEGTLQEPRRTQNRLIHPLAPDPSLPFDNEPDTDFSLPQNLRWAENIATSWRTRTFRPIPLVIDGEELYNNKEGVGFGSGDPVNPLYTYAKATSSHIEKALSSAKRAEKEWASTSISHRSKLLALAAQNLRERRGDLIGAMMIDGGKTIAEGDPEVSEAIDFAEYYRRRMEKFSLMKEVRFEPKGTILVTPPWNFPCAIPAGCIFAALITGNAVLFKPSSEAVLVAWHLVNALWDAGIPKEVLQFVPCAGEGPGSTLVRDPRVNAVILTGGTETARKFLEMRPDLDLTAEAGGKNAFIITALSDRELAIKDLIHSAFSHNGQKCSAASLAILEGEVYDDPHFLRNLRESAASLKMGLPWELSSKITPLIHAPRGPLKRALTTLEEGEEWLLEPKESLSHPNLWSPGIKLGVRPGSFTHQTELFGPVLGVMRADNLSHAIALANGTPYGLTSGLHSLDEREQMLWLDEIEAGNCYINRTTTGAIVRRQPFGGTKASSFGNGSKAGGPNYLREFLNATQIGLPKGKHPVNERVNSLASFLEKVDFSPEELGVWYASIANYAYWWKRLRQDRDPSKLLGQDNLLRYVPRPGITFRISKHAAPLDVLSIAAASLTVGAGMEISFSHQTTSPIHWLELSPLLSVIEESEEHFLERVRKGKIGRVRLERKGELVLYEAAQISNTHIIDTPVLASGRFELLHYLREVSISIDTHRYGNLGLREGELRKSII
jgi:RHH-type proline utilization regulon transcriptional repressor/proline dehydrogenase/delta 1-pyrroline-5-carboxylate dehydrogenase